MLMLANGFGSGQLRSQVYPKSWIFLNNMLIDLKTAIFTKVGSILTELFCRISIMHPLSDDVIVASLTVVDAS